MHISGKAPLLLCTFFICFDNWCQPDTVTFISGQHTTRKVTALLNDSVWYGRAHLTKEQIKVGGRSNWFAANFVTDLPHSKHIAQSQNLRHTGCLTPCVPSQILSFDRVPLAVGTFKLSASNTDRNRNIQVRYDLLSGGDAITDTYLLQIGSDSWIRITKYDLKAGVVEGAFKLRMVNTNGRKAYFKDGNFRANINYD